MQFFCEGSESSCPTITVLSGGTSTTLPQYTFVATFLDFSSSSRFAWGEVGWALLAVLVVALIGAIAMKVGSR